MKKATQDRKLFVRREEIARLGTTQLQNVVGGGKGLSVSGNPCQTTEHTTDVG